MESNYLTPFSKSILTGLFAGIVATLLSMTYNIFYRNSTGFPLSDFINVSSLIFSVNLVFLLIGFVHYGFTRFSKIGEKAFIVVFLLLTVVFALLAANIHRSDVPQYNTEFHRLIIPIVILMGLMAAVGIPYLYHSRKFEKAVL